MDARTAFVADIQAPKAMQPRERAFDDPPRAAETTAMRRATFRELRADAAPVERVAMGLRVVPAIPLHERGLAQRSPRSAAQRRNGVDQGQQLGDVVPIGRRQDRDDRNPLRVGENMVFRPGLAAIGRVRSSFFPPRNARSEALSTTARARSTWPRCRNSASRTACRRFHTPARCQRARRRQQVVPDPHPISRGSMFHGSPLRSTKRMPVSTARSGIGFRPAYCRLRRRRFGRRGSMRLHNASSIKALVMPDRLTVGQATVPSPRSKYKRGVS